MVRLAEAHRGGEPFEEKLRAQLHHVAILDRPGLAFVRVHDHDARTGLAPHRIPLPPRRKARTSHAGQPGGLEALEHLLRGQVPRRPDLVWLEQKAVRRMCDAADDLVAVQDDGREVTVPEARNLDGVLVEQAARPRAVAHRPGAHAHRIDGNLEERVERDDLVHVAVAQVHPVGECVGELRRDRPDLAADATEVVEQPRALGRQLLEQGREMEHVHASSLRSHRCQTRVRVVSDTGHVRFG